MTEIKNDIDNAETMPDEVNKTTSFKIMPVWVSVLVIYLFLLCAIGYIAFWDQDFNKPINKVQPYLTMILDYKKNSSETAPLTAGEITIIVEEIMKKDADSAGDLQELASQSFNIVLGAILAFLSASSTMVFQKINEARARKKKKLT